MKKLVSLLLTVCMCLSVGVMLTACGEEHTHALTRVEAVATTCETAGNSEYYTCDCGKYFSNVDGTTEIAKDSWVISATGHSFSNEWTYNETYHWKGATCDHTTEKSEYAEHTLTDNKCACGYVAKPTIELEGKTFKFISIDTEIPDMTYNSGSLVFKADNVIELTFDFIINIGNDTMAMTSTSIGTYELNDEGFLFTLTGVVHDGTYDSYPEEIAPEYANLQGVVNGNTIVIPSSYNMGAQAGIAYATFELVV